MSVIDAFCSAVIRAKKRKEESHSITESVSIAVPVSVVEFADAKIKSLQNQNEYLSESFKDLTDFADKQARMISHMRGMLEDRHVDSETLDEIWEKI